MEIKKYSEEYIKATKLAIKVWNGEKHNWHLF